MGLFDKLREPIFIKENSSAQKQLEQLQTVNRERLTEDMRNQLDRETKLVSLGIQGEKAIEFELRNSHMPMYVLHDLYLEHSDLSAQIDYLVITRKRTFVIECKNLYGNIEINGKGDFIRTVYFGSRYQKEGIYSPITQNQRHLEIIKQVRIVAKKNIITKTFFGKFFFDVYRSVIVLANPKTILNDKYAKKEIKSQVIRADALITHIKQINAQGDMADSSDGQMEATANFFLDTHTKRDIDYASKYHSKNADDTLKQSCDERSVTGVIPISEDVVICPRCGATMVLRTAKKGDNAGKQFWGCTAFPKCRGVVEPK